MNAKIAVIIPAVVVHHLDPHTGIPFMPHMAAHLAGALDEAGFNVQVIDCFGLDCHQRRIDGDFMFLGVDEVWVAQTIAKETKIAFLYCRTVEDLISVERIAARLRELRPEIKLCVFENIQTVNSFSLKELAADFLGKGIDVAVFGEPERRAFSIVSALSGSGNLSEIQGIAFKKQDEIVFTNPEPFNKELSALPFPLWEKFPLYGYWAIHFAHAPIQKNVRFLPILTSRGCPFRCTFCISPTLNPTWRNRTAKSIADEMEYFYHRLGITDFHVSDLDPTIQDKHTQNICREIISRNLPITWKIAQGTKIETIKSEETLVLLKQAGCVFLSFSPESGSPRMLKIMNKPFDHEYALKMVRKANDLGIRTQACFVAGVPGETQDDRQQSIRYVRRLVRAGVDEIAVTIFTPLPGAALSDSLKGYSHYSELTHSPVWREDYSEVNNFRRMMYLNFFAFKLIWPKKVLREFTGILSLRFQTKMEMSLFKIAKLYLLYFAPWLFSRQDAQQIQSASNLADRNMNLIQRLRNSEAPQKKVDSHVNEAVT